MSPKAFKRIPTLKSMDSFRDYLKELNLDLPVDDEVESGDESILAQSLVYKDFKIGNRFCIHPMEGWDGTTDGKPTEPTIRRWRHFGLSGAKWIWGGEAMAVRPDGRANPNQLMAIKENQREIEDLRKTLIDAHSEAMGQTNDLFVGLQLTHSGRFCRPYRKDLLEPRVAFKHPLLDGRFKGDSRYLTDDDLEELIQAFIQSAILAEKTGFDFVDIKSCHGYLGHEILAGHTREGKFGGSFENRTRFLRSIIEGIRAETKNLEIGVRISAFDMPPFVPDASQATGGKLGPGIPEDIQSALPYRYAFGVDPDDPFKVDLSDAIRLLKHLESLEVRLVNVSAGSPYYNPHIQRPALYPPSDGYQPPEDPLVGVVRQIHAVKELKNQFPNLLLVGTGYTYLQEYIPNVAQAVIRKGWVDSVGLGRLVLSYPDLPRDVVQGQPLKNKKICRTFSDCTTAPRNGIISGCFPLDPYYKQSDSMTQLKAAKGQSK